MAARNSRDRQKKGDARTTRRAPGETVREQTPRNIPRGGTAALAQSERGSVSEEAPLEDSYGERVSAGRSGIPRQRVAWLKAIGDWRVSNEIVLDGKREAIIGHQALGRGNESSPQNLAAFATVLGILLRGLFLRRREILHQPSSLKMLFAECQ